MRMWDKIFTIFQTQWVHSSPESDPVHRGQSGFQRFMEEYANPQGRNLERIPERDPPAHISVGATRRARERRRVVWRFYRWLYPHSGWASQVRLSDTARQDEHDALPARAAHSAHRFRFVGNMPASGQGQEPSSDSERMTDEAPVPMPQPYGGRFEGSQRAQDVA